MRKLGKTSEGAARANAVSGDGNVGGWEEIPNLADARRSIWEGREQMLLMDPNPQNDAHVSEVMAVNGAGTMPSATAPVSRPRTRTSGPDDGVVNIGRYLGYVCYTDYDWETGEPIEVCENRETIATSISNDGKVITGASRLLLLGIDDAAIYTRGLGWMLMNEFLASQGVLEMARWQVLGARVSGDGKVLTGTAFPLAGDYYQGYRLELDQVLSATTSAMAAVGRSGRLPGCDGCVPEHGDAIGLCPGDAPFNR
jgi:hypothetical protein